MTNATPITEAELDEFEQRAHLGRGQAQLDMQALIFALRSARAERDEAKTQADVAKRLLIASRKDAIETQSQMSTLGLAQFERDSARAWSRRWKRAAKTENWAVRAYRATVVPERDSLRAESLALRKAVEAVKGSLIAIEDVLNAGDGGIEIRCDIDREDCDHCVAQHHIDEAMKTLCAVGKKGGDV